MYRSVVSHCHTVTAARPRPWLVLGKGPSAARLADFDPSAYHVLSLNHACRLTPPAVAHFADLEAYYACEDHLAALDECVACLPWHPHVKCKPGKADLSDYELPASHTVTYNATTARKLPRYPGVHTVGLRFFSATAAFSILGLAGVRTVFSLGVDGGTEYAPCFDAKDRLANGRTSFDDQFKDINATVRHHKMAWTKL